MGCPRSGIRPCQAGVRGQRPRLPAKRHTASHCHWFHTAPSISRRGAEMLCRRGALAHFRKGAGSTGIWGLELMSDGCASNPRQKGKRAVRAARIAKGRASYHQGQRYSRDGPVHTRRRRRYLSSTSGPHLPPCAPPQVVYPSRGGAGRRLGGAPPALRGVGRAPGEARGTSSPKAPRGSN